MARHVSCDDIRTRFSSAMSDMYRTEVPQYGTLLKLVADINAQTLYHNTRGEDALTTRGGSEMARIEIERHGAIRLGTPGELHTMRRVFAVMGMSPVGYYDLAPAGMPVHATAFRPVTDEALARNPFRVFTSLLRLELIEDDDLRARAAAILERRQIFTDRLLTLLDRFDSEGGLNDEDATAFVIEALETFRWHSHATVDAETYHAFHQAHRLIADVVCFRGPHINHLTPRTLDIDATQQAMPEWGITPKATIEGPPRRNCPILLRQTSFKALEEPILFPADEGGKSGEESGTHTARFGEIEQRGAALTRRGRKLYDQLLAASRDATHGLEGEAQQRALRDAFLDFPDDETTLRREGLAWFDYQPNEGASVTNVAALPRDRGALVEALIEQDVIRARPITYEDFLPVSAAGIFRSNLGEGGAQQYAATDSRAEFEAALGAAVEDEFALYEQRSERSLSDCLAQLGLAPDA
ncbi:2-oxoadipate dioxygenase/decarboxylase HglS [Kushneria sp. Sum13]|uniref:2-oxoadipate dioxygenase/decarboxylase HglS n=1 Tax=Kushneria sp. Sum13 TaxID=3459196 RepID=UPI004045F771